MTRRELIAAATTFFVAACATGVADPLNIDPNVIMDAGTDTSTPSDAGPDAGDSGTDAGNDGGTDAGSGGDSLPVDAVIYTFASACPAGYSVFTEGVGRFPLGSDTDVLGTSSAAPFAHLEDPTHQHRVMGTIPTNNIRFIAVVASNGGQANGDDPSFDVQSATSTLNLGYVELRVCRKTVAPAMGAPALPAGSVLPFASSTCPSGFAPYGPANGRFVEGTRSGGTNEMTLGGAALTSGESFSHGHALISSINVPEGPDRRNDTGCCAEWYADQGVHDFTAAAQSVSTTLPFVRLLYCEKL